MKALFQALRSAARIGYVIVASVLVAMVFVQVFHAGVAVLVHPGDWSGHRNFGSLFAMPVMLMAVLSLAGWMPFRFFLFSLGLYALYMTQYLLLYLPGSFDLPALAALHPVNALVILLTAILTVRQSWRLVTADWPSGMSARRAALVGATAVCVLVTAALGLQPGDWQQEGTASEKPASLADAAETSVPEPYRAMQSPFAPADAAAVAAGQQIAEQRCIACHAADFKGRQLGSVRSADLTQSATTRSEQFLLWAVSEGSGRGMPTWKSELSEQERWQVVAFIKSLEP